MHGLKKMLLEEEARLRKIAEQTKEQLKVAPEGILRVSKCKNQVQYYQRIPGVTEKNGKYIPKSEIKLAKQLAQKTYNERVLKLVNRRLKQIECITREFEDDEIEELFQRESLERQALINPVEPTWKQLVSEWEKEEYQGKEVDENFPEIYAERGERVKSKSEKILADYFYRNQIPYKYEKPIYLKGYGIIYPDFTFISKKTLKPIYWEHEGMMDDPLYARRAVSKIALNQKNGIFPGESLNLTFETEKKILNTTEIEMLVRRYIL